METSTEVTLELTAGQWRNAIRAVEWCRDKGSGRYATEGIMVRVRPSFLQFAATDSQRLVIDTVYIATCQHGDYVLPKAIVDAINRLPKSAKSVSVTWQDPSDIEADVTLDVLSPYHSGKLKSCSNSDCANCRAERPRYQHVVLTATAGGRFPRVDDILRPSTAATSTVSGRAQTWLAALPCYRQPIFDMRSNSYVSFERVKTFTGGFYGNLTHTGPEIQTSFNVEYLAEWLQHQGAEEDVVLEVVPECGPPKRMAPLKFCASASQYYLMPCDPE